MIYFFPDPKRKHPVGKISRFPSSGFIVWGQYLIDSTWTSWARGRLLQTCWKAHRFYQGIPDRLSRVLGSGADHITVNMFASFPDNKQELGTYDPDTSLPIWVGLFALRILTAFLIPFSIFTAWSGALSCYYAPFVAWHPFFSLSADCYSEFSWLNLRTIG